MVSDDPLLVYFKLCKAGYASSVNEARTFDARTVLQALEYDHFCNEYESAYYELNKNANQ